MSTFEKRATPSQAAVFRIIAGACRNVISTHPRWTIDPRAVASIAKRAAGTLTAGWPDVLAAKAVSKAGGRQLVTSTGNRGAVTSKTAHHDRQPPYDHRGEGGGSKPRRPQRDLIMQVGIMAGKARRDGNEQRLQAFVDVLRLMSDQ